MDLYTIKKKIDNKQISSVAEFQKDVLLMLNNAKMFNRINSQVYNMAVELEEDALPSIQVVICPFMFPSHVDFSLKSTFSLVDGGNSRRRCSTTRSSESRKNKEKAILRKERCETETNEI